MSAQANVVIADSAAANHTFNPKGAKTTPDKKSVAVWRDQSIAEAIGYYVIQETWTPSNANGVQRVKYEIRIPTLESPGGGGTFVPPPTKAYDCTAFIEFVLPDRASLLELQNLVAYTKNFAALAYVANAVTTREPAW